MREELLPRFVRVPSGEFVMGADDGEDDQRPAHRVFLDAFHVAAHPITNAHYAEFVREAAYPSPAVREMPIVVTPAAERTFLELAAPYAWHGGEIPRDRSAHPVTLVTYADAVAYCRWLSEKIGRLVRLPTEAEWERAARGGTEGRCYPWGDDIDPSRANFLADPALKRHRGTRPVGSYAPNAFAIYDAIGNVWEWVADWYRADAYSSDDVRNPRGPGSGRLRLLRGGSWVTHDVEQLRCSHRHRVPPDTYAYSIGFRVVYSSDHVV